MQRIFSVADGGCTSGGLSRVSVREHQHGVLLGASGGSPSGEARQALLQRADVGSPSCALSRVSFREHQQGLSPGEYAEVLPVADAGCSSGGACPKSNGLK